MFVYLGVWPFFGVGCHVFFLMRIFRWRLWCHRCRSWWLGASHLHPYFSPNHLSDRLCLPYSLILEEVNAFAKWGEVGMAMHMSLLAHRTSCRGCDGHFVWRVAVLPKWTYFVRFHNVDFYHPLQRTDILPSFLKKEVIIFYLFSYSHILFTF